MSGVSCWNDANYGSTGVGYTSSRNTDQQKDSISSAIINPWTKVVFWADGNFKGNSKTFDNASVYPINLPDFKVIVYDDNGKRNINDSISSIQVFGIDQPACVNAMNDYLVSNPDVKAAGLDPWQHYASSGQNEGRYWPDPRCDGTPNACTPGKTAYLNNYPDVKAANMDAWTHYAQSGRNEGRAWTTIACDGSAIPNKDPATCPFKIAQDAAAKKAADDAAAKKAADAKAAADAVQAALDAANQRAIDDAQKAIIAAANNVAPPQPSSSSSNDGSNTSASILNNPNPAQTNQPTQQSTTPAVNSTQPASSNNNTIVFLAVFGGLAVLLVIFAVTMKPKKKVNALPVAA
jgi:hypothetical protein